MKIDCYGKAADSGGLPRETPPGLESVREGDCTYVRHGNPSAGPVHRFVAVDGGPVEHTWAWGAWADRARLRYGAIDELAEIGGAP